SVLGAVVAGQGAPGDLEGVEVGPVDAAAPRGALVAADHRARDLQAGGDEVDAAASVRRRVLADVGAGDLHIDVVVAADAQAAATEVAGGLGGPVLGDLAVLDDDGGVEVTVEAPDQDGATQLV